MAGGACNCGFKAGKGGGTGTTRENLGGHAANGERWGRSHSMVPNKSAEPAALESSLGRGKGPGMRQEGGCKIPGRTRSFVHAFVHSFIHTCSINPSGGQGIVMVWQELSGASGLQGLNSASCTYLAPSASVYDSVIWSWYKAKKESYE